MNIPLNYTAVLVAALVNIALGFLWYGPLFGKAWMKMMGLTKKDTDEAKKKGMTKEYLITFLGSIITAYVLALIVLFLGASTISQGAQTGFWLWLGFVATTLLSSVTWEGKPWRLYWLNSLYYLVSYATMGAILAVWY